MMLLPILGFAQKAVPQIGITNTTEVIKVDGMLSEESWQKSQIADSFYISQPVDSGYADSKTEVWLTYDEKYIYVAAVCYDDLPGERIIQSLKRDFSYPRSDAFSVVLSPFNDQTNGFSFGVNAKGAQREGLIQGGGNFGVTTAWDNIWFSAVQSFDDKWVVEMAIPFNSIRFKEGGTSWGINFTRNDLKRNESSSWSPVPRNFNIATLAFCGELAWDQKLKKPKAYVALIPYLSGGLSKDYTTNENLKPIGNVGIDAKIGVTSSLQLDLTVNPDFSQVEVDRQQTNLTRFNLFFPERRNFFIENSDLFDNFGFRQIRPFFSRRIGLDRGTIIPIIAGARLSGKIGDDWRIGVMNMQTASTENTLAENFSVAAVQRQISKGSNISVIGINKAAFDDKELVANDFNRLIGGDFNFASENRQHMGKVFFHKSFGPEQLKKEYAHASWYRFSNQNWDLMWNHEYVGQNYNAEVGFVPRINRYNPVLDSVELKSYWRFEPRIKYLFYPQESGLLIYHGPSIYMDYYADDNYEKTDNLFRYSYDFQFKDISELNIAVDQRFTRLFFDTDVTFTDTTSIPLGDYSYTNANFTYESNPRKLLFYEVYLQTGQHYSGERNNAKISLSYRYQPWGIFTVSFNHNDIKMPHLDESVDINLIGAQAELSFSKSIFFTTFLQYNTQIDNFNLNSRLQWRYRPLSDFYLVYSENYNALGGGIKNRALVGKLIFWFQ